MKNIQKLTILSLFIITIFSLYPTSGSVVNREDEINKDLKDEWKDYERKVEIQLSNDQIKIDSILKEGESKDKILFEIRPENDQIRIQLTYLKESDGIVTGFDYRVEFDEIIEYVENGSIPGYQQGEGVSVYNIGEIGWTDFNQTTLIINQTADEKIELFNIATIDGVFNLTFKLSNSISKLNDTVLTPNSIKMDVEINQFPNTTVDSLLALKTNVETKFNQENHEKSFEEELNLNDNISEIRIGNSNDFTQGYFSWAEKALSDGTIIDVHNSPLNNITDEETDLNIEEGEQSFKTYFSFLKTGSNKIFWDPTYAVADSTVMPIKSLTTTVDSTIKTSNPQSTNPVSGFEYWSIFVLLGISIVIRKKIKKTND